jgi:2'-5' RNA ligase
MSVADLAPGQHAAQVHDHWWWRPGWRVGRRFFAFHVTFEGQHDLYRLAATYRETLGGFETLTLVPDRWPHLTLQGLGFTDELPRAAVDDITAETTNRLAELSAVDVAFGEIVVASEAIAMPALPPEPIRLIRATIRSAIETVLQEIPEDPQRFRPHVSVAYIREVGQADPYVAAVQAVDADPAQVRIRGVDLIEMHRDHRMYEWESLASIGLGTN